MAYAFWKEGRGEEESVFNLFFRKNPFQGGYTITCGLSYVVEYLQQFTFAEEDLQYLGSLKGHDQAPLFDQGFLEYLRNLEFSCSLEAIPEGTVVFPHEPLIRMQGPIIQCQLLESPLLNLINYQSLVATKAARVVEAARETPIMEFGLRRAQGIDGALSASRAAYIGGCSSTSNVLAGKLFGIPVAGTHAHSWVMSFDNELESFKSYAHAMPNNCIFLVDTYDTIQGIKNAIEVGKILQEQGKKLLGVRIDSGDLAYFSNRARQMLDQAGFKDAKIVASNNLDENIIASLEDQNADIDIWGVGTKLATAFDQPALGGVYKLSAIRKDGQWAYKLKLSEQTIKVNNPGIQQVRRFRENGKMIADMIYDINSPPDQPYYLIDPMDATRRKSITADTTYSDLLIPIFKQGELVYSSPDVHEVRAKVREEMQMLDKTVKRFVNPHSYVVGLEKSLHHLKTDLILKLRHLK